jgi:hypothetical protein
MFISTGGVHLHRFERNDPIFPAQEMISVQIGSGTQSNFWVNNSTRAGVLGCVDSYKVCADPRGDLCWEKANSTEAFDYFSHDLTRKLGLYFLLIALTDSDAWHLVNYLGAAALNATERIAPIVGIQLAEEQWKVEAENIFAASLVGLQIRAFDYARGTYADRPSVIDTTPLHLENPSTNVRAAVEISGMFKYRDPSFKNVSAVGFWGINMFCLLLVVGSIRFSNYANRQTLKDEGRSDYHLHDNLLATIFFKFCFKFAWELLKFLCEHVLFQLARFVWRWSSNLGGNCVSMLTRP